MLQATRCLSCAHCVVVAAIHKLAMLLEVVKAPTGAVTTSGCNAKLWSAAMTAGTCLTLRRTLLLASACTVMMNEGHNIKRQHCHVYLIIKEGHAEGNIKSPSLFRRQLGLVGQSGQELHTFATVFPPQPLLKELATSAMTAARSMPERTGMRTTICSLPQRTEGGRALDSQEGLTSVVAAPKIGNSTGTAIPKSRKAAAHGIGTPIMLYSKKYHYLEANWLNGMAASCRCRFSSRMSHSLMTRPLDCSIRTSCRNHTQYSPVH